jgi:hypothetical protein
MDHLNYAMTYKCEKRQQAIQILYCIVLYCIVLYCIVLYCIALHCIVLSTIVWLFVITPHHKSLNIKQQRYMELEIQLLACDRHRNLID